LLFVLSSMPHASTNCWCSFSIDEWNAAHPNVTTNKKIGDSFFSQRKRGLLACVTHTHFHVVTCGAKSNFASGVWESETCPLFQKKNPFVIGCFIIIGLWISWADERLRRKNKKKQRRRRSDLFSSLIFCLGFLLSHFFHASRSWLLFFWKEEKEFWAAPLLLW
jgi:hypothetical protein